MEVNNDGITTFDENSMIVDQKSKKKIKKHDSFA